MKNLRSPPSTCDLTRPPPLWLYREKQLKAKNSVTQLLDSSRNQVVVCSTAPFLTNQAPTQLVHAISSVYKYLFREHEGAHRVDKNKTSEGGVPTYHQRCVSQSLRCPGTWHALRLILCVECKMYSRYIACSQSTRKLLSHQNKLRLFLFGVWRAVLRPHA